MTSLPGAASVSSGSPRPAGVIEVKALTKRYGGVAVVDGVSFAVAAGEIFGMVGPNGSGKTTTIECIEGLRRPDEGTVTVLGLNPQADRRGLAERIGVQLQESALPARLRPAEALDLFGAFYSERASTDALLAQLGLSSKLRTPFAKLSGGEKQRLFIALALVNKPKLVFFDELTTGLDPQARRATWDLVRSIRDANCTVFLTTHYMEEAEALCDRVLILDHGRVVALDRPEALIRSLGAERRLVFTLAAGQETPSFEGVPQVQRVERAGTRLTVYGHGERFASSVVHTLEDASAPFLDLRTEEPNLEDVFLALTGREMRD
jgi:ABC-2 type transport system ATP-binding protein